ncbi:MAG: hypothetical protein P8Y53_22080, partial [Pseudolabrys sp.]
METIDICKRTFGSVLHMMNVRPDLTYAQSAAAYYEWMQKYDPAVFDGIKARVMDGSLRVDPSFAAPELIGHIDAVLD